MLASTSSDQMGRIRNADKVKTVSNTPTMYRYMVERLSKYSIFNCLLTQSVQQELYTFAVLAYCNRLAL
jgi:hypothetical protein